MQNSITNAISNWLAQGNPAIELMLQHCRFQTDKQIDHLAIYCPQKLRDALMLHIHSIDWRVSRALLQSLDVFSERGDEEPFHEVSLLPGTLCEPLQQQGVDILGLQLLLRLGINFSHPIAIVEMGTNRGIFCSTGILQQSHVRGGVNAWIDEDMAKYHYPDELRKLETAVEHGVAHAVEWKAKTFQGEPMVIAANVYAGTHNGRSVRVTENLHWSLL